MRARREEIGAVPRDVDVLIGEAMHAVDDQQAAVGVGAPAVRARHGGGDRVDRDLHA